jgi:hypothetical protein
VTAPTELESRIALMVQLMLNTTEYLPMCMLQRIPVTAKMLRMYSRSTSVTINAQLDKTRSITVDPVCNTDRTLLI